MGGEAVEGAASPPGRQTCTTDNGEDKENTRAARIPAVYTWKRHSVAQDAATQSSRRHRDRASTAQWLSVIRHWQLGKQRALPQHWHAWCKRSVWKEWRAT
jgi:hypothetical protein